MEKLLAGMRRIWLAEHVARSGLLIVGIAINLLLLCWLLHRIAGLSMWSMGVVAVLALAALLALTLLARSKAPGEADLARMLDRRAGTDDLFSSALEFQHEPGRFGWLGEQTVLQALAQAGAVALKPRWSIGRWRNWSALGSFTLALLIAAAAAQWWQHRKAGETPVAAAPPPARVVAATSEEPPRPVEPATSEPVVGVLLEPDTQPGDKSPDETVKITSDMVEKYLDQAGKEPVDLTGVTPIRWDQEETSGKSNPQEQNHEGEKVDPVKLDASLLKDLEMAKKTKDESGGSKEGGVDIAVMGNQGDLKAKGNQGGKGNKENLSDAVSKDPRGEASRMAVRPPSKALPIRSVEKIPTREKGEDRPMTPLDFAGALERMKLQPAETFSAAAQPMTKPEDRVVRQEGVAEPAVALTESYFDLLRKADR